MDSSDWLKRLNHEDDTSLRNNWAIQRVVNTARDVFTGKCDMSIWITDIEQLDRQIGKEFIFYVIPHTGDNMTIAPFVKDFMYLLKMEFDTEFKPRYKKPDKPAIELFSTTQECDLYMPVKEIMGGNNNRLDCDICVPYDYYAVPEYIVFITEPNDGLSLLHTHSVSSLSEVCSILPYNLLTV